MEYAVKFTHHARYSKLGEIQDNTKAVWFVLHGYGQLAPYFIKKFQFLADEGHCIIAPEGLSRFYIKGFYGKVGATWMTKEDRLRDIENYLSYLDALYAQEIPDRLPIPINLLGFSQGAATISRWVTQSEIAYDKLILWAGTFPPDMNRQIAPARINAKPTFFVYGKDDLFITKGRLSEQQELVQNMGLTPEIVVFDGDHDIHPPTLKKIAAG